MIPLKEEKRKRRNDVIFIAAILLALTVIGLILHIFSEQGDTVTVTVDQNVYGIYPLNRNAEIEIRSQNGFNLLIIRNGEAFVESASCPDGICSSHRPIKEDGESIICLPNRVVISVSSENKPELPA